MLSPGNLPPNAYQSMSSRVMRIPMRHTFTLDQKRILMKYFEQGMVGQSLMYQEKIQQCAQEAGLEFDVVRNWIGNQRRKRRLEEVQRACMQNYMDSVPPEDGTEGLPPAAKLPSMTMGPRQTQVLFLPHMAKQQQQHPQGAMPPRHANQGAPPQTEDNNHGGPDHHHDGPTHSEGQSTAQQVSPLALTAHHQVPAHLNHHVGLGPMAHTQPHTTSPRMPARGIPPYHQAQTVSGGPSGHDGNVGESSGPEMLHSHQIMSPHAQQAQVGIPPRSSHSSPANQATSPSLPSGQCPPVSMPDDEIGFNPTPIRGFFPAVSRAPRMMPGAAHPVRPQQRMSPQTYVMYPGLKMAVPKETPELRHHEIRRIVEQIQMSLDRLEQLGCESLLATVSTADRSAYVCGTPIALQYFSLVNKDLPMAEYIHKKVSNIGDVDDMSGLDDSLAGDETANAEEVEEDASVVEEVARENHKGGETANTIGQSVKLRDELTNEEEEEIGMIDDSEGIIKAGDEVYIVNKDRMVIGSGMLYPRPHEKIAFKNSPEYAE